MPHVAFVPFTGLRVRESEMLELGMTLPGLRRRAEALAGLPALGLLTLAGMTPKHWTMSYHESSSSDCLLDEVMEHQPDLVAVSALTASVLEAYRFCDAIRETGTPVVIGGLHATALPDEAVEHASVCVGDGEASWLDILRDSERGKLQPVYRSSQKFDLSSSPTPRFDLLPKHLPQRWTIQTQRGCPWACEFCGASRLLGPPRYKTPLQIRTELNEIKKLDRTPWIELADDNTFAGRNDWEAMLWELKQAGIRYFTENDWQIGTNPTLIQRLAESGCIQVLIGIESLAFRYPGMGHKATELNQICEAIEMIQSHGIVVNGCFIAGADGETHQSLDALIEFVRKSELAEIQLTLQTPFPGTRLYQRMKQASQLLPDRDWSAYTLFDVVYQPDRLTVSELEAGFRRTVKAIFSESESARRASLRRQIWRRHPLFQSQRRGPKS